MKSQILLFVLLMLFVPVHAMSGDASEDLKLENNTDTNAVQENDSGFITQKELHQIATNYYTFIFSEEHEFKRMLRKKDEGIIKDITPVKEYSTTVAYIINYNPSGNVIFRSNKNIGTPMDSEGSGTWLLGVEEGYLSSYDSQLHPLIRDGFHKLKKALDEGRNLTTYKQRELWEKFNVPIDSFHERANFDKNIPQPDWWIEKKKAMKKQNQ